MELAIQLKEFIDNLEDDSDMTIEDFYDYINIPKEHRNDFATASLLKQYLKLCEESDDKQ